MSGGLGWRGVSPDLNATRQDEATISLVRPDKVACK